MIGNTRALWSHFVAAMRDPVLAALPDPLDHYTEDTISAAFPGARIYYSHRHYDGQFLPFQQLAVASGLGALAPSHLVVHPIFGPWFALRAAILLNDQSPARPSGRAGETPDNDQSPARPSGRAGETPDNDQSPARPSGRAGETPDNDQSPARPSGRAGETPDNDEPGEQTVCSPIAQPCRCTATCSDALALALASPDWRPWLAVRDACTLRAWRYTDDQIAYHYTKVWRA